MDEDREAMLTKMINEYKEENAKLKETIGDLVIEKDRLVSLLDDIRRGLSMIDDDINDYDRNKR